MFYIDNETGLSTMPTVASKQSNVTKWFTEGDDVNPPSYPGQDWFNMVQAELLNILKLSDITPQKGVHNQLAQVLQQIATNLTNSSVQLKTGEDGKKYVDEETNFIKGLKINGSNVPALSDFSVNTTDNKNRYFTLPSGDPDKPIIIQTGVSNGTGSRLYTYPTAFPNNLFCLVAMTAGQGGDFAAKDTVNTPNILTQMKLVPYNASSGSITTYAVEMHIIAIGN